MKNSKVIYVDHSMGIQRVRIAGEPFLNGNSKKKWMKNKEKWMKNEMNNWKMKNSKVISVDQDSMGIQGVRIAG